MKIIKTITRYVIYPLYGTLGYLLMQFHLGTQGTMAPRTWRSFLLDRYDSEKYIMEPIEVLLTNLKRNLDVESQKEVDRYLYRVIFAVLLNKTKTLCIPNNWELLRDTQEKEDLKKISYDPSQKDFDGSEYLEINDNGLKYLPEQVQKSLNGKDFIDGGAFIGDSIRVLVKYKPLRIYAFEPNAINRSVLSKNCQKYGWKGIIPIDKGLGESKMNAFINLAESISRVKIGERENTKDNAIEIIDIDNFVRENNVNLGVIKLDVEGLELAIINGAIESIKKYKPVLLISIYHTPDDFFRIKPLIESWNLGYQFFVRKLAPHRAFGETMLIGYVF